MFTRLFFIAIAFFSTTVWAADYRTLEWTDLMTPEDRQKMAALPEIEHLGEEIMLEPGQMSLDLSQFLDQGSGNPLDSGGSSNPLDMGDAMSGFGTQPNAQQQWREVLTATATVAELNNQKVRIAGFIVPLEFDDNMVVTEFFLVPYFGACIHVPPPPPNQLVYVTMEKGIELEAIYDPFWVSGILTTEGKMNDTGFAAYSMAAQRVDDYSE
ncbi:DUF3299 domain-containing protein [Porticoccus sp. W117]|uniref:DUF3299 domain-containing protein n=1 Tax=Porticoccus sp. W117 TaxID=3054777 RepID=UPI002596D155|nr:DUF3299 domain-containing protein [Porticoccus sp. W117]MDM3871333.1 DUF3299 domain-containing protein [Porticoccus sp. W117]